MGESSYKSMRASSMDEVIFSGTNNRPARNNAEVGISIDNASARRRPRSTTRTPSTSRAASSAKRAQLIASTAAKCAPATCRSCSRRFHRRAVAGVGASGPHRRDHPGKPEQRRRVLEEAAGVAGLHARRHEAELRLKAAETTCCASRT